MNYLIKSINWLPIILLSSYVSLAQASYNFYFTNNTTHTINYHSFLNTHVPNCTSLPSSAYDAISGHIKPYEKALLFRVNYDRDIKNGKLFCFSSDLTLAENSQPKQNDVMHLNTVIQGQEIGSFVKSSSLSIDDAQSEKNYTIFSEPPRPNDVVLEKLENIQLWDDNNKSFYGAAIRDHSLSAQLVNEIDYVLDAPVPQFTRIDDINTLAIGTYNVQLWPSYAKVAKMRLNQAGTRATLIPKFLKNYDIVVVEELMDKNYRNAFSQEMQSDYPYQYGPLFGGTLLSSGTMVYSHWPILKVDSQIFQSCYGVDCGASKGIIYTQFIKGNQIYNFFGIHAQAIESESKKKDDEQARDRQFDQVKLFIHKQNIPPHQPVILAGDFNVDYQECFIQGRCDEYNKVILSLTDRYAPWTNISILPYGGDPSKNLMNTGDFGEMDDYILPIKSYLMPISQTSRIRVIRGTDVPAMYHGGSIIFKAPYGALDLSDHFMFESKIQFPHAPLQQ